ncbi:MAG: prepilin peptidase [Patescibacteria group bacterium]|jgi:prepilin signal peptidase PulO-like enzyme (type II secretory pathway)|nr:prepilin peptidase [Patescibacteria group bacterium]
MVGVLIFILGIALGSFFNVVVYRLANDKSFLNGRSFCPDCRQQIAWYDNIPLLSFMILRGRCRHCRQQISWQYPAVELATGLIFIWLYYSSGLNIKLFAHLVFASFLILIFVYDLKYYQILDRISLPAICLALIFNLYLGFDFSNLLLGALIGSGFFAVQFFGSKGKWVGDGDIRLGALMGLILGWQILLVALFIAYLVGAAVGLFLIVTDKKKMSSALPFGPFLSGATLVAMIYGKQLLSWYLNLIY